MAAATTIGFASSSCRGHSPEIGLVYRFASGLVPPNVDDAVTLLAVVIPVVVDRVFYRENGHIGWNST